jgi:hypothetical protein
MSIEYFIESTALTRRIQILNTEVPEEKYNNRKRFSPGLHLSYKAKRHLNISSDSTGDFCVLLIIRRKTSYGFLEEEEGNKDGFNFTSMITRYFSPTGSPGTPHQQDHQVFLTSRITRYSSPAGLPGIPHQQDHQVLLTSRITRYSSPAG